MSFDLLAVRTPNLAGHGTVMLNLFDKPAQVRGIQLLAQRFLTLFLRETDDRMNRGTPFMAELMSGGRIINDPFLVTIVGLSILRVQEQLPRTGDPDEILARVRVLNAQKRNDGAFVRLELTAQSGDTTVLELPRIL